MLFKDVLLLPSSRINSEHNLDQLSPEGTWFSYSYCICRKPPWPQLSQSQGQQPYEDVDFPLWPQTKLIQAFAKIRSRYKCTTLVYRRSVMPSQSYSKQLLPLRVAARIKLEFRRRDLHPVTGPAKFHVYACAQRSASALVACDTHSVYKQSSG